MVFFFFFKQKTAYEIPKRDWSSDVCSSDLVPYDPAIAVETPTVLEIEQDRPNHGQAVALTAEQEFMQVGGFANYGQVLLAHVPNPCALNQIGDQGVELAEAVGDAGQKPDDDTIALVFVQEVQLFRPDPLQPPEGHFPNDTPHLPNQPAPSHQVLHSGCERSAI